MAEVYERECLGHSLGSKPLILTRCHNMRPFWAGSLSVCGHAYNVKGIKGKISLFLFFLRKRDSESFTKNS